jgi:hypothetical protein
VVGSSSSTATELVRPLSEIARVLVGFDYVARFIINANHSIIAGLKNLAWPIALLATLKPCGREAGTVRLDVLKKLGEWINR